MSWFKKMLLATTCPHFYLMAENDVREREFYKKMQDRKALMEAGQAGMANVITGDDAK